MSFGKATYSGLPRSKQGAITRSALKQSPILREAELRYDKTVIPGEPISFERDPESRKLEDNQSKLDPGSLPASVFAKASPDRSRDLAGMRKIAKGSDGEY